MHEEEMTAEEWILEEWGPEDEFEDVEPPRWRRWLLAVVASIVVLGMAAVPIYNVVNGAQPDIADNGLEVCGFDYCVVQDAVRAEGLDLTMSALANTYLNDEQTAELTAAALVFLGEDPVAVEVVDRLDRQIAGQYVPETRTILIERPSRAWIVLHEAAHVGTLGHGEEFQETLIDLAVWLAPALN
jgi:hypothetical protein